MTSREPRLLILDCDGVLIRSERANLSYYNHLFQAFGLPAVSEADRRQLGLLHTLSTPQVIEAFFPPQAHAAANAFAEEVDFSLFVELLDAEPGWHQVLRRLRRHLRIAVATNRGNSACVVLERVGLLQFMDLVVTIRDVSRPKPHPDMLLKVLAHFEVDAPDAIYVGDSALDRQAAAQAEVPFLGFRDGERDAARCPEDVASRVRPVAIERFSDSM